MAEDAEKEKNQNQNCPRLHRQNRASDTERLVGIATVMRVFTSNTKQRQKDDCSSAWYSQFIYADMAYSRSHQYTFFFADTACANQQAVI